jgi:hypothetical protein
MTYDLLRLRLKGLVARAPHTNTYTLSTDGPKTAVLYTKLDRRLLHPLLAADKTPAPPALRAALATIDKSCVEYINRARLAIAA